jgi:LPPG:FO 2-phospho-L-lactate transferase
VTETLRQHRDRVTAISPIVASAASSGPEEKLRSHSRAALLASIGLPATASGVARLYRDVCTRFVYDPADRDEAARIAAHGLEPVPAPLLAARDADPAPLLAAILGDSPSARVTG